MTTIIVMVLLVALAYGAPRAWKLLEAFVLAPLVGVSCGGVVWCVSNVLLDGLFTFASFCIFAAAGIAACELFLVRCGMLHNK